jgi:SAM-dependent methyltransferase
MNNINKNLLEYNKVAWDKEAERKCPWSIPVDSNTINNAKQGTWEVKLTPSSMPSDWLGDVSGKNILCLASGGGQQAPVLAAAGARVTVIDNSPKQLEQDRMVAERDGLQLATVEGDMRDLSMFGDEKFDIIFHPISNLYAPDIKPVWKEAYRILCSDGILLSSFYNPVVFVFDKEQKYREQRMLKPKYTLPYSDLTSLEKEEKEAKIQKGDALCFGHTLTDQIGGQIQAGFLISGFYEDYHPHARFLIDEFMPTYLATKAIKLQNLI